jgi:Na+/melibiose symporter-like transporter
MYFFAGAITILWGIVIWFVLPPDPIRARGFDERQRYIAVARLQSNNSGVRNTHFKREQVFEALKDVKFWLTFSFSLLSMITNGPISTFIPIIINGLGFSTLNSLLLFIPAGAYAGTMMLLMPFLAQKYPGWRTYLATICQCIAVLASFLLWFLPRHPVGGMLFACYILPSVGASYAIIMGLQVANTAGYTKRSITSAGIFVGYCLGKCVKRWLGTSADNVDLCRKFHRPSSFQSLGCSDLSAGVGCRGCNSLGRGCHLPGLSLGLYRA